MTNRTLAELADAVDGKVVGDGSVEIREVKSIEDAGPGEITFLANPRYQNYLAACRASAVIVGRGVAASAGPAPGRNYLEAADPYFAFAKIHGMFNPEPAHEPGVSAAAHVDDGAQLGADVTVYPNVYICRGVHVGPRSVLFPGVFLGEEVRVGTDCRLHPNVVIRHGCRIGDRVVVHAGTVVGSDGFGYATQGSERVKIPQVGIVEIDDDVEIGANTTVDRATFGRTRIGRGSKIDNLVQIAHNVVIGEDGIIAAQVGIAGSTRLGKNVTLAGQAGVVNHAHIGDGAIIGPQSGVAHRVAPGAVVSSGLPAAPHQQWLKVMVLLPRLPELWSLTRRLERKLADLLVRSEKS